LGQHLIDLSRDDQIAARIGNSQASELGITVVEALSPGAGQGTQSRQLTSQLLAVPALDRELYLDPLTAAQELIRADHGFPHRSISSRCVIDGGGLN
jgi:hypothetical protein